MNDPAQKPRLRGVLHQWSAFLALFAGIALVAAAPTTRAAWASAVFAASLVVLLVVSATYHRIDWAPAARQWMRRADHASIFVLIAGTCTPVIVLGLPPDVMQRPLVVTWAGATVGILQSLFWIRAPKLLTTVLAVALGWSLTPYLGDLHRALPANVLALVVAGGCTYTLGAVAYATKRPDVVPGVFGYHEVFHACTVVAAALHYAAILDIVRRAT